MNQKGFSFLIIILGIISVIGITGGAYYFGKLQSVKPEALPSTNPTVNSQIPQPTITPSSSPDETSSWKIYDNKELDISFKYPKEWQYVTSNSVPKGYSNRIGFKDKFSGEENGAGGYFFSFVYTNSKSLSEVLQEHRGSFITSETSTTIANTTATKLNYGTNGDIVFQKGDKVFIFTQNYHSNEANQILSTFKFTQ